MDKEKDSAKIKGDSPLKDAMRSMFKKIFANGLAAGKGYCTKEEAFKLFPSYFESLVNTFRAHGFVSKADVVPGKFLMCPDRGRLIVCMDCENRNNTSKCQRPMTVGDLMESR